MPMMTGLIGCILLVFAIMHAFIPQGFLLSLLYGSGALLAFIPLKRDIGMVMARVLAVCATALMFFYFANFFHLALRFNEHWLNSRRL